MDGLVQVEQEPSTAPRFGTAAVQLGLITAEQLKDALMEQLEDDLNGRPHRVLGAILSARGWLAPEQIPQVLQVNLGPNFLS
jgi:hypothetical protein